MRSRSRERCRRDAAFYPHLGYVASLSPSRMRLELGRIARVLERLGDPQRAYPAILVAGTNGKGSVTAYCAAMLHASGLDVGAYYSPHLCRVHERIKRNGAEISSRELDAAVALVRAAGGRALTYFECLTAAAMLYFRERAVDIAVFEVGLGGRLDATNLVAATVTVVTGISHDHRERLGATKRLILGEKLGIVRSGAPLVARLADAVLERQAVIAAAKAGASCHLVREEAHCEVLRVVPEGMTVRLETNRRNYGEVYSRMIGAAQADNIATAARTIEVLADSLAARRRVLRRTARGRTRRTPLDRLAARCAGRLGARAVRKGAGTAFVPGRFQIVSREPLVVVDVSHNEESFGAALDAFRMLARAERPVIVFGMLAHKELGKFPRRAVAAARAIITTSLADRRSATAEALAAVFRGTVARDRRASIIPADGMAEALRAARREAGAWGAVLVMGSHAAVEEAAPHL